MDLYHWRQRKAAVVFFKFFMFCQLKGTGDVDCVHKISPWVPPKTSWDHHPRL